MIKLRELINEDRNNVSYGCLMAYIPEKYTKSLNKLGNSLVPEDDLYKKDGEFGRENEKHFTIKYGFSKDLTKEEIEELISGLKPFSVKIKSISIFENGKTEGFDVVKFDGESKVLEELHEKCNEFPNKDEHKDYKIHMTIAYVKPGTFKHKKDNIDLQIPIDKIVYSPINGEKMTFKLNDKKVDNINERLTQRNYDYDIKKLELEWDRLDNMGGRETRQQELTTQILQLQKEKEKWENMYKAAL